MFVRPFIKKGLFHLIFRFWKNAAIYPVKKGKCYKIINFFQTFFSDIVFRLQCKLISRLYWVFTFRNKCFSKNGKKQDGRHISAQKSRKSEKAIKQESIELKLSCYCLIISFWILERKVDFFRKISISERMHKF